MASAGLTSMTKPRQIGGEVRVRVLRCWPRSVMTWDLAGLGLIGGDLRSRAGYRAGEVLAGCGACWLLLTALVLTAALPGVLTFPPGRAWLGSRAAADG
jgi:hypothetical protein